jgi:hypothetical protein
MERETKKKLAEYRKQFVGEKNHMYGKKRKDLSERNKKPKYWITNGEVDKLILVEDYDYYVGIGFIKGRLFSNNKGKGTGKRPKTKIIESI